MRLAKLPTERRTMSYRRIRAIDFHEFCRDLENSSLVRDAETSDLSDFVNKYNNILKSLLDTKLLVIEHSTKLDLIYGTISLLA